VTSTEKNSAIIRLFIVYEFVFSNHKTWKILQLDKAHLEVGSFPVLNWN